MLQPIWELYGDRLAATDGELGHARGFCFHNKSRANRYSVADTGTWLSNRLLTQNFAGIVPVAPMITQVSEPEHAMITRRSPSHVKRVDDQ